MPALIATTEHLFGPSQNESDHNGTYVSADKGRHLGGCSIPPGSFTLVWSSQASTLDSARKSPKEKPYANSNTIASAQSETGLPPNWEVRHSNSKNLPYYFNSAERTSRWEPPAGTDSEKLKHYMAAHHSAGSRPGAVPGVPEGKIRAAHLLVKHRDSRRPSSWREVRTCHNMA